jgi:hypothetical protein
MVRRLHGQVLINRQHTNWGLYPIESDIYYMDNCKYILFAYSYQRYGYVKKKCSMSADRDSVGFFY